MSFNLVGYFEELKNHDYLTKVLFKVIFLDNNIILFDLLQVKLVEVVSKSIDIIHFDINHLSWNIKVKSII